MKAKKKNKKVTKKLYDSLSKEEREQYMKYYKEKTEEISKDRYKWLTDICDINNSIDLFHEKEWELIKLFDKINEYQLNLSGVNVALIKERKRIMNYITEIENCRCKKNI